MHALAFLFFCILGAWAQAEGLVVKDGHLVLQAAGKDTVLDEVRTFEAGTKLYHWASEEAVDRRSKAGRVEAAEMEAIDAKDTGPQGGGVYTSLNPFDASGFGSHLLILELPKAIRYVRWGKLDPAVAAFGGNRVKVNAALRAAGLSATLRGLSEHPPYEYVCVFDPDAVTKTHRATFEEEVALYNGMKHDQTEAEELFRLIKIANQGPLAPDSVKLDYRRFPIIQKLLMGKKPTAAEVKRLRQDPYFYRLQFMIVPGTRVQITDPSALALATVEWLFNEEEIDLFVIALRGTARFRKRPLNLMAPTLVGKFPRVADAFAREAD